MFRHIPEVEFAVLFREAGKRFCLFRGEGAAFLLCRGFSLSGACGRTVLCLNTADFFRKHALRGL